MADELNAAAKMQVEGTQETGKMNASEKDKHVPEKIKSDSSSSESSSESEHSDGEVKKGKKKGLMKKMEDTLSPKSEKKTAEVANKQVSQTKVEDKKNLPSKVQCKKSSSDSGSDSKSDSGSDSKSGSKSGSGSDSKSGSKSGSGSGSKSGSGSDSKSDSGSDSKSSGRGEASAVKGVRKVEKKKMKKKALKNKMKKTTKKTEGGITTGDKLQCDSSDSKSGSGDDSSDSKSGSGCESSGNKGKSKIKGANKEKKKNKKGLEIEKNQPAVTENEVETNVDKAIAMENPEQTKETDDNQDDGKAKKGMLGKLMDKLPGYSKNGGE